MASALEAIDTRLKRMNLGEWLVRRNPLYYGSTRRQMDALLQSPLEERVRWTRARLTNVLEAARRTPYGKTIPADQPIERWPLLSKETLRDDPHAFRAGGSWFAARATTGGTTGTPVSLIRSPAAVVAEQVCRDRMMRALGVDPVEARVAVLRADSVKHPSDRKPPYWKYALGGRQLILSSAHLNAETLPAFLHELERFRADVLWVHPSMLEVLCRLLMQVRASLRVAGVFASSEVLRPEVWELARNLLGCAIVDCYGQAERVAYAHAREPHEYFFLPGYAYVELIERERDEEGTYYEVVGTSLWNLAMPLVRYCTGDLIHVRGHPTGEELAQIAYGLRPFHSIVGRSRDVLLAPDARSIIPGLSHIPRGVPHLLRLQIVQESPERIVLRALTSPAFSKADRERLLHNARRKIPAGASIELQIVDHLERTAGGKTPFVVHAPQVQRALREAGLQAGAS